MTDLHDKEKGKKITKVSDMTKKLMDDMFYQKLALCRCMTCKEIAQLLFEKQKSL